MSRLHVMQSLKIFYGDFHSFSDGLNVVSEVAKHINESMKEGVSSVVFLYFLLLYRLNIFCNTHLQSVGAETQDTDSNPALFVSIAHVLCYFCIAISLYEEVSDDLHLLRFMHHVSKTI